MVLPESRTKSNPSKISRRALWIAANTDSKKRICSGPNRSEFSLDLQLILCRCERAGREGATWKTNEPSDRCVHVHRGVCCPLKGGNPSSPTGFRVKEWIILDSDLHERRMRLFESQEWGNDTLRSNGCSQNLCIWGNCRLSEGLCDITVCLHSGRKRLVIVSVRLKQLKILTVLQSRYKTSAAGVHRSPVSPQTEAKNETLELQRRNVFILINKDAIYTNAEPDWSVGLAKIISETQGEWKCLFMLYVLWSNQCKSITRIVL